ncbi:hypothetical protein CSC66_08945 [Pseudoxanthomonas kaohsiungensis]|nr:hypothetical protein CSC66_08945 [Pseudoxanthomonas kaohsiungensis]
MDLQSFVVGQVPAPASPLVEQAAALGLLPIGLPFLATRLQTELIMKGWGTEPQLPAKGSLTVVNFPPGADAPTAVVSLTDRTPTDARSGKLYQIEFAAPAEDSHAPVPR